MLEQHGRQEGAVFRVVGQHVGLFVLAKEPFGFLLKARHLIQHVLNLGFPNQRPHADPFLLRIADLGFCNWAISAAWNSSWMAVGTNTRRTAVHF